MISNWLIGMLGQHPVPAQKIASNIVIADHDFDLNHFNFHQSFAKEENVK